MRAAATAVVACALVLAVPSIAGAHATLKSSQPARGATVAHAPGEVGFRFDEPVEGNFGAVRVFDSRGRRVDRGDVFHPEGAGARLAVHLQPGLADGLYTATYRVVSADGHVVAGGVVFSVGHAGAGAGARSVDELLGATAPGAATRTAFSVARAVQFGAIAVAVGTLAFLAWVWAAALVAVSGGGEEWRLASEAFARRARALLLVASAGGVLSAASIIVLEAAEAAGIEPWRAARPSILREELGTRFGAVWSIATICWVLLGAYAAVIAAPGRPRVATLARASLGATGLAVRPQRTVWPVALPAGTLLLAPALSGHAAARPPVGALVTANALHVAAMSVWVGGIACLLFAVPSATRRLAGGDGGLLLNAILSRFSTLALAAVGVVVASGIVQAYAEIPRLALLPGSAFGRAVLVKVALLLALVGLGALNRRRTLPRLRAASSPGAAGVVLRCTLRAELALLTAALLATGALAGYAPAASAPPGPFAATARIGAAQAQIAVDPARVGANALHLTLADPRTGAPLNDAREVSVTAALPEKDIGAITQRAAKAGPGHFIAAALPLAVPGTWRITVTVRVSAFDEYTRAFRVRIR